MPVNEADESREIKLPQDIYNAPSGDKNLIRACSRVFECKSGNMYHNGNDLGISFQEFLSDTSNCKFLLKYEPVYNILSSNGYKF